MSQAIVDFLILIINELAAVAMPHIHRFLIRTFAEVGNPLLTNPMQVLNAISHLKAIANILMATAHRWKTINNHTSCSLELGCWIICFKNSLKSLGNRC